MRFDKDISVEPPEEWRAEIDQTAVPGGIFGEIVFFHKESKTLILADTIINLELDKIRQPWRFAAKLPECAIRAAKYSSACGCRSLCRNERRERRSEAKFPHTRGVTT